MQIQRKGQLGCYTNHSTLKNSITPITINTFNMLLLIHLPKTLHRHLPPPPPTHGTFWSTMEHTRSLTADSDTSPTSRLTVSLVSPIWSRKDTPWKEPRELVGLEALWLPLESRL